MRTAVSLDVPRDELPHLLAVARGDRPADLVLTGGRVVDVFGGTIEPTDVAIAGRFIAGLGSGRAARATVDLAGAYLCPGFIDAHVHVESAMVPPREFAALVVPHGVTTAVTDPHEIANVLGQAGVRFMLADAAGAPFTMFVNASSCVPATPLATAGATLDARALASLLDEPAVLGLAEVMNFPGVVAGDPEVLAKIAAFRHRPIDGHAPGLAGRALDAYVAAGMRSDHECTTADEARRKLRLGLTIFVREGSVARDLDALLGAIDPASAGRFCFCTDDKQVPDLLEEGSIDHLVRRAIARGLDPITALRMATLHPAEHFGLADRGAIAPGRRADLVAFADLGSVRAEQVWVAGRLVARAGRMVEPVPPGARAEGGGTVRVDWSRVDLAIPAAGSRLRVIGYVPGQLLTRSLVADARIVEGRAESDPGRDLLKMAVIERHGASGRVGLGFVQGMGIARGAIAGTVAHDHHNLVVLGADDASMLTAARRVAALGGGLAAADGPSVLAELPLPIAGLMSDRPALEVASGLGALIAAAGRLGSPLPDPFMALSFLALEVIPSLKLTDQGLVDVETMRHVPLFLEAAR